MSTFKCQMCGGNLEVAEGLTIAECEYCGSKQTVPKAMDENMQKIFNRATTLRIKSEFDKAEKLYEKIIQSDSTQSEAYWGLILCKYGIEYVDDPVTFKKVPTCHRASYDSIIADDDYKSAIENADMSQRMIYEEQAKEIDRIQKEILALAQKEASYDVFICYKETDASGSRTQDSVIANDIYYQLTNEGYKVFYAAITLEGKLGSAYEPIIFAALNSAKVMLAIGTKPEYFNAVWVKNEWSRYLKIIKNDRSKLLIPCYRDMDAYELPDEFAHLQAQDMAKIGFINDIVRGIQKVITKDEPKNAAEESTAYTPAPANIAPLIKRAFMFLEDGEWSKADDFCEQVLNQDPENVQAYLGKLMAELKVKTQEDLKNCSKSFDENNNYKKIVRFGDDNLKNTLDGYITFINEMNRLAKEQEERRLLEKKEQFQLALEKSLIRNSQVYISAGSSHTVGLKSDGTVYAIGSNIGWPCKVGDWSDIVSISAGGGHTVGLKTEGTAIAIGGNDYGQCNVFDWSDIVSISAGGLHTVGLRSDGTVVAVGDNRFRQCKVSHWSDIVVIAAGYMHTVGLKSDGTVIAIGDNEKGQCNVSGWSDIVAISAGGYHTVGLKSDGTVIAIGYDVYGRCDVSDWSDIVAISAGYNHTVGLKSDGTVVAIGDNENGRCNVSGWSDMIAISAGGYHTVGLKSDGTVHAIGFNGDGRCNVSYWTDIVVPIIADTQEEYEFRRIQRINEMKFLAQEREEQKRRQERRASYRRSGVCQYCGGRFKGLFTKTCSVCGKTKDY